MAYDPAVVKTAYATAVGMGASGKVLLALFEAAIVESGFRNLNYGDRDSKGFLQQRASMGWANPTDVATATRSFVSKAKAIEGRYATAGQLAQAVQRSAFPLRYDAVRAQASTLLSQVSSGTWKPDAAGSGTPGATPVGFSLGELKETVRALQNLSKPEFWRDTGYAIAGGIMVIIAVALMAGWRK
jgi:hypothetical protein